MQVDNYYSKDEECLWVGFVKGLYIKLEYPKHNGKYSLVGKIRLLKREKGRQDKLLIDFDKYRLPSWTFKAVKGPFRCDSDDKCIDIIKPGASRLKIKKKCQYYPLSILHELGHAKFPAKNKGVLEKNVLERIKFELKAWFFALQEIRPYQKLLGYQEDTMYDYIFDQICSYI